MAQNHIKASQNTFTKCSNCKKAFTTSKHLEKAKPEICDECKEKQQKNIDEYVESPFNSEELLKNE